MSASQRPRSAPRKPLSCAECRRLKIKCELKFPCAHCVKKGMQSVCPDGKLVPGTQNLTVLDSNKELYKRIVQLEQALKTTCPTHPVLVDRPRGVIIGDDGDSDAMGQAAGFLLVGDTPEVTQYYGSASSLYLAKRSISHADTTSPHGASFSQLIPGFGARNPVEDIYQIAGTFLPPIEIGRALAQQYFEIKAWGTMIVQPSTWEEKIFDHVYGSVQPNPQLVALALMVFAVSARLEPIPSDSDPAAADRFLTAALNCLSSVTVPSVTYVQCIYLFGLCVMNGASEVARGDTFWPILRTAIGMAEALGLHRDGSHWGLEEPNLTERRFVFWSIHHFDVVQSVALGRGQGIADDRIDCRIPDIEGGDQFFSKSYELVRIVSRINSIQTRCRVAEYFEVKDIDQSLWHFERSLPFHLSAAAFHVAADGLDAAARRTALQRNQLLLYLNEARLALLRPWFVRALQENPAEPSDGRYKTAFVGCFEACRAVINYVSSMIAVQGSYIHRRWHFFFHLFSACTCLAAIGIRAPTSTHARSSLSELDRGVALFRAGKPDMLSIVEQLRNAAVDSIYGRSSDDPNQSDISDLLGSTTILRRQTFELPSVTYLADPFPRIGTLPTGFQDAVPSEFDFNFGPMPTTLAPAPGEFDVDAFLLEIGFTTDQTQT